LTWLWEPTNTFIIIIIIVIDVVAAMRPLATIVMASRSYLDGESGQRDEFVAEFIVVGAVDVDLFVEALMQNVQFLVHARQAKHAVRRTDCPQPSALCTHAAPKIILNNTNTLSRFKVGNN